MKTVRIWFKKDFECRYISHLDLNRCMLRALHKSKLPVWHTEGFNPHPFATFPLPLSLGFRGVNECMDVKLEDDNYSFEEIISKLNACLPRGIQVFDVTEPVMKAGKIAFAEFSIKLSCENTNSTVIAEKLSRFLESEKIEIEKRSKKGLKTVDIKQSIKSFEIDEKFDFVLLNVVLSAGSSDNVNPNLLVSAFENYSALTVDADITRIDLYNADMELFR
ncbi:TIGR03936 family radical SAM-associated protein [uncultured Ruminococcus sp.]|uniref:TIGR03936 family radical SAM-associated protein n=1 Tax=uncultured Ruminococcus sp. TaxID=165186 RepID=UPI0025E92587|nr:TIGR03936 family radical SAM-associated protein [uncultured Ruminococcus sp.]